MAGDSVAGQDDDFEAVEGGDGRRKVAGEAVVAEVERLEVGEAGDVRDGAGEGVALEAQHSELVQLVQALPFQSATYISKLNDQLRHPPTQAFLHALPPAKVCTLTPRQHVGGVNG